MYAYADCDIKDISIKSINGNILILSDHVVVIIQYIFFAILISQKRLYDFKIALAQALQGLDR